ncbi:MAG: tRNA (adenosine(37)-N6)-threonylcarbamoyltransferase complex ATPase subunit type 1 TsaE [bacterium]
MKKPSKRPRAAGKRKSAGRSPRPATSTVFESRSPDDTRLFGEAMGKALRPGEILLLTGPLGAGKTVFVRGLARGLGIDPAIVRSPTYLVAMTYPGRIPLLHVDLYRKESPESDLIDEILSFNGIVAVEWGERLRPHIPACAAIEIEIVVAAASRKIRVTGTER